MPNSCGHDSRSGKIVYFSGCLLNQNRRFPGIAVERGAVSWLAEFIVKEGIGIEQIPCPECRWWGGVERKTVFRFIPTFYRWSDSALFTVVRFLGNLWLGRYRRQCRGLARRTAADMADLMESGYSVVGVVGVDDSPSCGVSKTMDIIDLVRRHRMGGRPLEQLRCPDLETMRNLIPGALFDGQGVFMQELAKEMKRRGLTVPMIGFSPWIEESAQRQTVTSLFQTGHH